MFLSLTANPVVSSWTLAPGRDYIAYVPRVANARYREWWNRCCGRHMCKRYRFSTNIEAWIIRRQFSRWLYACMFFKVNACIWFVSRKLITKGHFTKVRIGTGSGLVPIGKQCWISSLPYICQQASWVKCLGINRRKYSKYFMVIFIAQLNRLYNVWNVIWLKTIWQL